MRSLLALVLVGLASGVLPASAQSTLGTIRGTVYDPQQGIVPGASIVITDEATSQTREVTADAQGLYEIPDLRSGTYTVSASLTGFKKVQRTGVVLRPAAKVIVDLHLEVGGLEDVVTVTAEGQNNITLESQAIARGLDDQQLRDLPRNSRDVQDFLVLNPNVVGGFDAIQFLGGRTYGASYVQDGQPSSGRHLRRAVERGARPRRDRRSAGAVELVQRGVRRPGRRHRLDQARRQPVSRHVVLRLQLQRAERAHLRADAQRRVARRPELRHARPPLSAPASAGRSSPTGRSSSATTTAAG